MSHISSINLKKSKDFQVFHNSNTRPNYAIGGELSYTLKGYEALKLKNKIIEDAKEQYTKHTKQKFQAKSYEWSAVCNIKPETTMQDLEKLASHFNEKYGFQCYQIAIHRDEGHINEQGEKIINHHAHLEFITLDKETGKNNYRRELITPKVLREIQSEVAEILQMQRGEDKRLSGRQRIEPRKYAQMKEAEKKERKKIKQEFLNIKEIKERLEIERKMWIEEKNHSAQEYKRLREIAKNQFEKIEDLENAIKALKIELDEEKIKNKKFEEKTQMLEKEIKNRDIFINNLGNLLNFRDLKYNTPINELERYLNPKEQKNEELYQKENKNDLKGNFEANKPIREDKPKESENKTTYSELLEKVQRAQEEANGWQEERNKEIHSIQEIKFNNFKDKLKSYTQKTNKPNKDLGYSR
ncbi:mobilization protein [Campylobacter upsaliensis]|nr:mobilization protein [Campylobacter upsaliensis]EKH7233407.1 mobilization protein [Campylobacter upsaliensis]